MSSGLRDGPFQAVKAFIDMLVAAQRASARA